LILELIAVAAEVIFTALNSGAGESAAECPTDLNWHFHKRAEVSTPL
jgi:hypothetical protein